MARIALISTNPESVGHDDTDLVPLRAALESVGFEVAVPSWRDPAVDWSGFELAICAARGTIPSGCRNSSTGWIGHLRSPAS